MSDKPSNSGVTQLATVAIQLRAPDSPVRAAMSRLDGVAPPPLECSKLMAVCIGASCCAATAIGLLKQPNPKALAIRAEVQALAAACIDEYERRGESDTEEVITARTAGHPAWFALGAAGGTQVLNDHAAASALGVELCLSWLKSKKMATAFAAGAGAALGEDDLQGLPLVELFRAEEGVKVPHWVKHAKSAYIDFLTEFEAAPPAPPEPKSFEDRATMELRCRAAFASFRRRAGILDDTCLSHRQIKEALAYKSPDIFRSLEERQAALWIVGVSGLFTGSVPLIPLAGTQPVDWVVFYDVEAGHLHRDYSCLAKDAARAKPGEHTPASFCAVTPAPLSVRETLLAASSAHGDPRSFGDLIPALRQLDSRQPVYPDLADLSPSFARWGRTLAPLGLQIGCDSLLNGVTTGDLGTTARSKIHYCLVGPDELHASAALLYAALNFGPPVPMPAGALAFGAAVVPPQALLRRLDGRWSVWVEEVRPPQRLKTEGQLLEFHNRYVRTFAARLCLWLSLRRATEYSLLACIDEAKDICVDLVEKGSAHRTGGMAAVICGEMRAGLKSYFAHCAAMRERLRGFGWHGPVIDWLDAVGRRDPVPLLCTIPSRRGPLPFGTSELLTFLPDALTLAPDFGRKFAENYLRRAGARWADLDRHQRHEVKGQEQDTTVADGTEEEWAHRLAPLLDQMSTSLFSTRLHGLRRLGENK